MFFSLISLIIAHYSRIKYVFMVRQSKILAYSILFLFLFVVSCQTRQEVQEVDGQVLLIDSNQIPAIDLAIDSVIEIYRSPLEGEMNRILAVSAQPMRKGTPEDLLNNFVADLVLERARLLYQPEDGHQIDFCMLNYGGLRTSIPEGPVTQSRIFEIMPFENEMVVLTISAENAWALFEYIASRNVGTPVSGIRLGIRDRKVADILIGGEPFDNERSYKVLTSDYLAAAGDNMRFFLDPVHYELIGMRIRDAMIMHLEEQHQKGNMITSQLDGRIYYAE